MPGFIDRRTELAFLEKEFARDESSLVILYGRRRIGKTALITVFGERKQMLYYLATEESEAENRRQFKNLVSEFIGNQLLRSAQVDDWYLIFDTLLKEKPGGKLLLALDEFQYLGKKNPAFPSIFQKIWDSKLKDANVMVVLCGSLISLMKAQTLDYSAPLYGRRTGQIRLKQIPFSYYGEFFEQKSMKELVELYGVTGGVPKYIELFRNAADVYEAIESNILSPQSLLYEEPAFLLQNEVSEIGSYFSLLKAIAQGNTRQGKIATVMEVKQTGLPKYLKTLIDLDILSREVPVTDEDVEKSKKGLYRINDNFLRFWFQFVYPNRYLLETNRPDAVIEQLRKSMAERHTAYVYEDICRERARAMIADGALPGGFGRVGRWWDKDDEIDLAALNSEDGAILFGECKYTNAPMDTDIYYALRKKAARVRWRGGDRKETYVFFSVNGFTPKMRELAASENLLLFS